jgi:hypothetical protein
LHKKAQRNSAPFIIKKKNLTNFIGSATINLTLLNLFSIIKQQRRIIGGNTQMRKSITLTLFIILAIIMTGCVRPASGTTVKIPTQSGQSNPISTQSALMKEIIAGTQTAMALVTGGTPAPGVTVPAGTQVSSIKTATPVYASPTPGTTSATIYPTLTPGPPPVVEPTYISGPAGNAVPEFVITKVVQDWSVTIQTTTYYPANNTFTVRMGPYGSLGVGGTVVGFTNSGKGGIFTATYIIPNALRGSAQIHIRMDGENGFFSYNYFYNTTTQ